MDVGVGGGSDDGCVARGEREGWHVREIEFEDGDDKEGDPEEWEGVDRDLWGCGRRKTRTERTAGLRISNEYISGPGLGIALTQNILRAGRVGEFEA